MGDRNAASGLRPRKSRSAAGKVPTGAAVGWQIGAKVPVVPILRPEVSHSGDRSLRTIPTVVANGTTRTGRCQAPCCEMATAARRRKR
jgi:hypothetical protein